MKFILPDLFATAATYNTKMNVSVTCMAKAYHLHAAFVFQLVYVFYKVCNAGDWNYNVERFLFAYCFYGFYEASADFPDVRCVEFRFAAVQNYYAAAGIFKNF